MDPSQVSDAMFLPLPGVPTLFITRAEGVYLYEASGARFIDASGGPMAVNIGHGRKEVAEAARRGLGQVSYVLPVFASPARVELVGRIRKFVQPSLDQIYFCSGGSEANEAAVKLARQYQVLAGRSSRYKIVSRNASYHGMTLLALSLSDVKVRQRDFLPMLWKNPRVEPCYCYRCPFGLVHPACDVRCARQLEEVILREGPETVAAFLAEPIVASAGGCLVPPPEYWPVVRKICDAYDVVFIADEVVTGFGRTGRNMGMDHFGVEPDIATFAKGASSAYAPFAGMAVRREMANLFLEKGAEFQHLYTFSAHPLSCAVACEVLRILEEERLVERAAEIGSYLGGRLEELRDLPVVGDVRGKGMLWAVELVADRETREPFPKEKRIKMEVITRCMLRGVFFYPGYYEDEKGRGDHIMISPPFVITKEQVDTCVEALRRSLEEIQAEHLRRP